MVSAATQQGCTRSVDEGRAKGFDLSDRSVVVVVVLCVDKLFRKV